MTLKAGPVTVTGATGDVRIGDPASNWTPNVIGSALIAVSNTGGGTISDNIITGSSTIGGNAPPAR